MSLKDILEGYRPKSKDEQKFVDKHVTIKHKDRNGNDDDVFNASKIKTVKRSTEHGYDLGQDEKVYEEVEDLEEEHGQDHVDLLASGYKRVSRGDYTSKYVHEKSKRVIRRDQDKTTGKVTYTSSTHVTAAKKFSTHKSAIKHNLSSGMVPGHGFNEEVEDLDESYEELMSLKKNIESNTKKMNKIPGIHPEKKRLSIQIEKDTKRHKDLFDNLWGKTGIKEHTDLSEISHETRGKWLHKTFNNHLKHYDHDKKEVVGPNKGPFPPARQKIFQSAQEKHWKEGEKRSKEEHAKKILAHTPKVHDLRKMSHGDVYDHTQTSEEIEDGDVLHVKGGVAAMVGAWPTMIHGKSKVLHSFKEGSSIHTTDGGIYKKTGETANKLHKGIKEETELSELSAKLLNRYMDKAQVAGDKRWVGERGRKTSTAYLRAADKVGKGFSKVHATEEVKLDESISKVTDHLIKRYGDNVRKSHVVSAASDFGVDSSKLSKSVRKKLNKTMLDELSKKTLGSYVKTAADHATDTAYNDGHSDGYHGYYNEPGRKVTNRLKGIKTAVKKLTKEDIINNLIDRFVPEDFIPKSKEDKLMEAMAILSPANQKAISKLFGSLDEDNQTYMLELAEDVNNLPKLIDFAIQNREES